MAIEKQVSENAGASFFFLSFFFFWHVSVPKGSSESQAFLSKTVETGKKNPDDSHCMQMSLVMNMQFIFEDDENDALS